MASMSFKHLQQEHLSFFPPCKYPLTNGLKTHFFTLSTLKNTILHEFSSLSLVRSHASGITEKMAHREQADVKKAGDHVAQRETGFGFSSLRSTEERVGREYREDEGSLVVYRKMEENKTGKHDRTSKTRGSGNNGEIGSSGFPSMRSIDERTDKRYLKNKVSVVVNEKMGEKHGKTKSGPLAGEKMETKAKKAKVNSAEVELRIGLDMCSKRGDVMGAISLYDSAIREGIKLEQYHYNVLLYLCSSAAVGIVHPAKSGTGSSRGQSFAKTELITGFSSGHVESLCKNRIGEFNSGSQNLCVSNGLVDSVKANESFATVVPDSWSSSQSLDKTKSSSSGLLVDGMGSFDEMKLNSQHSMGFRAIEKGPNRDIMESNSAEDSTVGMSGNDSGSSTARYSNKDDYSVRVSEDVKMYALERGFEIYEKICSEKIPLSEAALTSVARMAMAMGNGDMAFEIVKKIKALGLTVRLRSYGPALFIFCNNGNTEKAFEVEKHMLDSGVYPEEPELEALLRVSVEAASGEKVYYLLHKLRTSVRQVSPHMAKLIETWFKSSAACRVGKRKWDGNLIAQAMENGGGGWHGLGWLGKGKWSVSCTDVDADGVCGSCGEKLVTIDIDPVETENFARSVASIAGKRERNSFFQKFQKWLDYYGPFEAVVDAANVGLLGQRQFSLTKVNTIVSGIRQRLPSKKWPLIIVHNKRLYGGKMDEPTNMKLIEKWRNADAIYATPTGSNDDWYWLYAAIKCKALIVTNDEMRDHIFQILGNDFFPKWKERHQVHFKFRDGSPEFQMPPPCSVVIQESEKGHWHIPLATEHESEIGRTWLCVTRANSHMTRQGSSLLPKEAHHQRKTSNGGSHAKARKQMKLSPQEHGGLHPNNNHPAQKIHLPRKLAADKCLKRQTVVSDIEAAEKLSGWVIDFQI